MEADDKSFLMHGLEFTACADKMLYEQMSTEFNPMLFCVLYISHVNPNFQRYL